MKNSFLCQLKAFLKTIKFDVPYFYLVYNTWINKVAVACEKDLSSLLPIDESLEQAGVKIVAVTPESLNQDPVQQQSLVYPDKERYKSAMDHLKHGCHGVAIVSGNEVCGDIWYASEDSYKKGIVHPDLKWLKLKCGEKDVYAFDMYLNSAKRGKNLANLLQNGALHEIRKRGYHKVFGYYWLDNFPALWVHRSLKWKELKKVKVNRFLWFYSSHEI